MLAAVCHSASPAKRVLLAHCLLGEGLALRLTVSGEAMMPWLPSGTVVRVAPIPPEGLRPFDIVVVESRPGAFSARRVISVSDDSVQTKGDSWHKADSSRPTSEIIGRVIRAEMRRAMADASPL